MKYNFIPKEKSFMGFSFSKEFLDSFRDCLENYCDTGERSLTKTLSPLYLMASSLNGSTFTQKDIKNLIRFMHDTEYESGKPHKWLIDEISPGFSGKYLDQLFTGHLPSFIGFTKSEGTPSAALSYINTHKWLNDSWRRFLYETIIRIEDTSFTVENYFDTYSETWQQDKMDRFIHMARRAYYFLANDTSESFALDTLTRYGSDIFSATVARQIPWLVVFGRDQIYRSDKRMFKRGVSSLSQVNLRIYPIVSALYQITTAHTYPELIAEIKDKNLKRVLSNAHSGIHDDYMPGGVSMNDILYEPCKDWGGTGIRSDEDLREVSHRTYFWNTYPADMEKLCNILFTKQILKEREDKIIEVHGAEIVKFYHESMVDKDAPSGTLAGSCMRHDSNQKAISFYPNANASLLVMLSSAGKVIGRAILWRNARLQKHYQRDIKREIPNEFITFMDRVYFTHSWVKDAFLTYAKEKGYWFKARQTYEDQKSVVSPDDYSNSISRYIQIVLPPDFDPYRNHMPFVDTFHFYDHKNNMLCNATSEGCQSSASYNNYNNNLGGVFRHVMKPNTTELELKFFKKERLVLLTHDDRRDCWNLRSTNNRPSRMYDKWQGASSGSCKYTKHFGWLSWYTIVPYKGENISVPTSMVYTHSESSSQHMAYEKKRGKWQPIPDDKMYVNKAGVVPIYRGFNDYYNYDKVPRTAVEYCPGIGGLVWAKSMSGGASAIIDDKLLKVSKAFIQSIPLADHSNFETGRYTLSSYLQNNTRDWCWSNFGNCYVLLKESVHLKGVGIIHKSMLGAYSESIAMQLSKLHMRIEKARVKAQSLKPEKPTIPVEINNLINN